MKKCLILTVVLSTAAAFAAYAGTDMKEIAAPVIAPSDAGFYVAIYGGAQFATDYGNDRQTLSYPGGSTVSSNDPFSSSWGGAGGIKGGYNFESFPVCDTMSLRIQPAVEAEALYLGASSTSGFNGKPESAQGVFVNAPPPPIAVSATTHDSYNSAAWFINGILRFKNSSIVTPYIGLGVGGEYVTIHGDATTNIPGTPTYPGPTHITGLNGSDLDWAGQVLGGLDFAVANHFSIFTEYKFIDAIGTNTASNAVGFATYRFKPDQIQQHLIVAGVKYSF
jgi:opacity protein-like surface antigen